MVNVADGVGRLRDSAHGSPSPAHPWTRPLAPTWVASQQGRRPSSGSSWDMNPESVDAFAIIKVLGRSQRPL